MMLTAAEVMIVCDVNVKLLTCAAERTVRAVWSASGNCQPACLVWSTSLSWLLPPVQCTYVAMNASHTDNRTSQSTPLASYEWRIRFKLATLTFKA